MRKGMCFLVVFSSLIFGCSSDTGSTNSTLKVDGDNYVYDYLDFSIPTGFEPAAVPGMNTKSFYVTKAIPCIHAPCQRPIGLIIDIHYPLDQVNVNGTYSFTDTEGARADGYDYRYLGTLISGSVTITDLGNNKYKIVLNGDCIGSADDGSHTLTGFVEGSFSYGPWDSKTGTGLTN